MPKLFTSLVTVQFACNNHEANSKEDYIELLKIALNCAKNRVVLKQPRYADPIKEIRKHS